MFAVADVVGVGATGHRKTEFLFLRRELLTKNSCHPIISCPIQAIIFDKDQGYHATAIKNREFAKKNATTNPKYLEITLTCIDAQRATPRHQSHHRPLQ